MPTTWVLGLNDNGVKPVVARIAFYSMAGWEMLIGVQSSICSTRARHGVLGFKQQ